jgi:Na+-transporting NADH:ubiquinone oxidoreductase subunit A
LAAKICKQLAPSWKMGMLGPIGLETRKVSRVALLGNDFRGVNFELLCQPGDQVQAGAELMRDARRPAIRFVAPASGKISSIERGARRKLISLQIDVDESTEATPYEAPATQDRAALRGFMLESGAWSGLRTRPFGNIPDPDGEPAAIFVTALDTEPLAPEARLIIDTCMEEFRAGVKLLADISEAPLFVCHAPQHALEFGESSQVRCVSFNGGYSASLPGVHINALCPIGFGGGEVWHIAYQEVIALGHLRLHGLPWLQRIISLGGNAVKNPRSLCVSPGAVISELLADELHDGPLAILAGSATYGRVLTAGEAFLAAGQRQITVQHDSPGKDVAGPGALIPSEALEALAPPGIYPVPLMRALQVGDAERARQLGALELVEEDLAPLSEACQSRCDYGLLLRAVLDQLEGLH